MPVIYEEVIPTPIENTKVLKGIYNGVHRSYVIGANEGYVLHDNTLDAPEIDENTYEETGNIILGYTVGTTSCAPNYDWTANPREFYAVLRSEVPENQIFGGGNNDHEVM